MQVTILRGRGEVRRKGNEKDPVKSNDLPAQKRSEQGKVKKCGRKRTEEMSDKTAKEK